MGWGDDQDDQTWDDVASDRNQEPTDRYRRDPNQPYRSIWDDPDDDEEENPAEGYKYRNNGLVQNKGNSIWGAPAPGTRWGDGPNNVDLDDHGDPVGPRGGVSYGGFGFHRGQTGHGVKTKYDDVLAKYQTIRHPGGAMRRKIKAELERRMPKAEARKIMKDHNWL
jgi:hypothetical protein